jgi:peptidoglycan/xylan/chitin deacetylase (PgdA/CDA1 family)
VPHFPAPPVAQPVPVHGGPEAQLFSRVPTTQPVAFLTMDDGWTQAPDDIQLMAAAHIPFMMFLIAPVADKSPDFFHQMVAQGGVVGDHTITHPTLRGMSYDRQRHEMCASATTLTTEFGARPTLFRPPFGEYDHTTLRAAHDCGFTAVVNWSETVDKGIVRYQTPEHRIRPGDIILMHFRPAFIDDVLAALKAISAAGLTPALLTDYLVAPTG